MGGQSNPALNSSDAEANGGALAWKIKAGEAVPPSAGYTIDFALGGVIGHGSAYAEVPKVTSSFSEETATLTITVDYGTSGTGYTKSVVQGRFSHNTERENFTMKLVRKFKLNNQGCTWTNTYNINVEQTPDVTSVDFSSAVRVPPSSAQ